MPSYVSKIDNMELSKIPTPKEIKATTFQMQDLKAPIPDCFPTLFYKNFWPTVSDTVIQVVTSVFTDARMPSEVNNSLIVLIPKTPNPSSVNNFRPISLYNLVYKIISRLLVAKLRPLLHKIISPCQSAFILGRWIVEN